MYSNNSIVPQQSNVMGQYQHPSSMHGFATGLDLPKLEPLSTPEVDKEKEKQARENHCEIERRRRVKMAAYFNELCVMVNQIT